jgi:hypothetical protein
MLNFPCFYTEMTNYIDWWINMVFSQWFEGEWQDFKIKKWNPFIVQMEKLSEQSKTGLRLLYVSFNKINRCPYYKTVLVDHAIVQYTKIQNFIYKINPAQTTENEILS